MAEKFVLKQLCFEKRYEEVMKYWDDENDRKTLTDWDYNYVIQAAYNLQRYQDCLDAFKEQHRRFAAFDSPNYNLMGWALYRLHIRNFDMAYGDVGELKKKVDYILAKCTDERCGLLRWFVVKPMINAIEKRRFGDNPDYRMINDYLNKIDPQTLTDEIYIGRDEQGNEKAYPSNRETWYTKKTQTLIKVHGYEECIKLCRDALKNIKNISEENKLWFVYRLAQSEVELNRLDDAEKHINQVLAKAGKKWLLYKLLYDINFLRDDKENVYKYGCICALCDDKHESRYAFYEAFACFLYNTGKGQAAMLHRRLAVICREKTGARQRNYETEWDLTNEYRDMDEQTVLNQLMIFWKKYAE